MNSDTRTTAHLVAEARLLVSYALGHATEACVSGDRGEIVADLEAIRDKVTLLFRWLDREGDCR